MTGRGVQTLVDVTQPPATCDVVWRPEDMAAGLYLYRLTIDGEPVQTRRAAVVK